MNMEEAISDNNNLNVSIRVTVRGQDGEPITIMTIKISKL